MGRFIPSPFSVYFGTSCVSQHLLNRGGLRWALRAMWVVLGSVCLVACDSSTSALTEQTTLNLRIDAYVGAERIHGERDKLINFQRDYRVDGRSLTMHSAHIYVSEITLLKADGTTHTFQDENPSTFVAETETGARVPHTVTDKVLLFRHALGQDQHFLGLVELGAYTGIRFKLGLEGLTNRIDASDVWAKDHPLGSRDDFINYWSPEKGYIFLRMDGRIDSDKDGSQESQWAVHLGTSEFVNTLEFAHDFTLTHGEPAEIHLKVDYAQFIAGLDYDNPDELVCYTTNNLPVARKVNAEIPRAFTLQGVQRVGTAGNQP